VNKPEKKTYENIIRISFSSGQPTDLIDSSGEIHYIGKIREMYIHPSRKDAIEDVNLEVVGLRQTTMIICFREPGVAENIWRHTIC